MVEPALQTKCAAHHGRRRHICDQRIARRRPQTLAEPVHDPQDDHLPRRRGHCDDGTHGSRQEVTADDQAPASLDPVREPTGDELYERGGGIRGPVERAQRQRASAQHARDERREQRIHHLTREIVEKGNGTEQLDLPGKMITHPSQVPTESVRQEGRRTVARRRGRRAV